MKKVFQFLLVVIIATNLHGQKISNLPELVTAPDVADILVIVDNDVLTTKKITVPNLLSAGINGSINFLAYFNGANSVISANGIGVTENTLTVPVTTGKYAFGDGDSYWNELTDDRLELYLGAANILRLGPTFTWTKAPLWITNGSAAVPSLAAASYLTTGIFFPTTDTIGLSLGGVSMVEYGGSQTALFWNQTATTGVSQVIVRGGAGQASTTLQEWQNNAGTVRLSIDAVGQTSVNNIKQIGNNFHLHTPYFLVKDTYEILWRNNANITSGANDLGLTRATTPGVLAITDGTAYDGTGPGALELAGQARIYGAFAAAPATCDSSAPAITAAGVGSTYFDTGDSLLCVCIADGTDDAWVSTADYSHATGHCTF